MDQPGIRLQDCALGCRSSGLAQTGSERRLQSDREKYSRRFDCFGARHSSGNNRSDAVRVEGTRNEGIQIRDRFGIDRDGNASATQTFAHSEAVPKPKVFAVTQAGARKIDIFFADAPQLILPA